MWSALLVLLGCVIPDLDYGAWLQVTPSCIVSRSMCQMNSDVPLVVFVDRACITNPDTCIEYGLHNQLVCLCYTPPTVADIITVAVAPYTLQLFNGRRISQANSLKLSKLFSKLDASRETSLLDTLTTNDWVWTSFCYNVNIVYH